MTPGGASCSLLENPVPMIHKHLNKYKCMYKFGYLQTYCWKTYISLRIYIYNAYAAPRAPRAPLLAPPGCRYTPESTVVPLDSFLAFVSFLSLLQNFHRLPHSKHVTKVVIGSSELLVCIWKYTVLFVLHLKQGN